MDEKTFREWLKTKYPEDWESIWSIWGTNYQDSPYYQEAIGVPGTPQTPDWLQGLATIFGKSAEEEAWEREFKERGFQWGVQKWQYEQEQQNRQAAQEQWWRQTSVLENAKQQAHEQTQRRLAAIYNRGGGGEAERAQASDLWNEWRNRISAATPDWDFMKKWQVGQM